jgi:DNA-binding NarL/FixJ family response regulator
MPRTVDRPRIVVADDQPIFLRGLATALAGDCAVLASAADPRALRRALERHRPDVAIVGLSGPGATDEPWLETLPACDGGILALTDSHDGERLATWVLAGVRSVAPRGIAPGDLVAGIGVVAAGKIFIGARAATAMTGSLTARDQQIEQLRAANQSAAVAEAMRRALLR